MHLAKVAVWRGNGQAETGKLRQLTVKIERFPIAGRFTISRGSRTEAVVVTAEIHDGPDIGRGECVPYPRYGETVDGVAAEIEAMRAAIEHGLDRKKLNEVMPAGAARNALDCAVLDLEAKQSGVSVWQILDLSEPQPLVTAYTLSLDTPDAMHAAARANASRPVLKIKLGSPGDRERLSAVRAGAPDARIIVDANEGWSAATLADMLAAAEAEKVSLIEQPLPAGADDILTDIRSPVPLCADESAHTSADIERLSRLYDAVNIKLDKTGGLTEAAAMAKAARASGLQLMIGCMVGSSLAMAPALLLGPGAEWVDLDGPLLLATDRDPGLRYEGSLVYPGSSSLWG